MRQAQPQPQRYIDPNIRDPRISDTQAGISPGDLPSWTDLFNDPFLMLLQLMMLTKENCEQSFKVQPPSQAREQCVTAWTILCLQAHKNGWHMSNLRLLNMVESVDAKG